MYEMFSRKEPYAGEDSKEVLRQVADPAVNKRPPVPHICTSTVSDVMIECFEEEPTERPTASALDVRLRLMNGSVVKSPETTRLHKKKTESDRTDVLLEQLFPCHVAEALKEGRKVEPEMHDQVTIVFSDIVGYTEISSTMSPTKVSDLLDRLYREFDQLCERLDVFKVETIGDA